MSSPTGGVNGGTVRARLRPNKLPLCARNWPITRSRSVNMIYSRFPTRIFPVVRLEALRRQNPAKPQNLARVQHSLLLRKRGLRDRFRDQLGHVFGTRVG